jgi:hypothetical protein
MNCELSSLMIPPLFGKQEVGIWWVKKRLPRYGVPIWSLWPNIRFLPSIVAMLIFRRNFLSNYWWQESDIWSQASYRYPISWEAFLDPSDSYFLFADLVGFWNFCLNRWAEARKSTGHISSPVISLVKTIQQADEGQMEALDVRRKLKGMCWSSRVDALNTFKSTHTLIVDTL